MSAAQAPATATRLVGDVLDSPDAATRVIRGSVLRSVVYLLTVVANLAALPLLFRHLGVDDSGRYVTVLTVATLVGAVVETGFSAVSIREFALRGPEDRRVLMSDLIALRGAALLACGLVAVAFLAIAGYPAEIVAGSALGVAGVFFEALSSTYSVWLSSTLRLGWMAGLQVVRQGVAVVATIGLIVAEAPLMAFFVALTIAGLAQVASALYATRGAIPHLPASRLAGGLELLRRCAPFVAAMALSVLYFRLAMILMPALSSDRETGYLGIPFRLLEIVTLISVLLLSSTFPIISRAAGTDSARHRYALLRLSEVAFAVGLYVSLIAFVAAPLIVEVVGGAGFEPATGLLRILSLSLAAKFLIAAWAFSLLSLDRHAEVLLAGIAATAVALVLSLVLIPALDAEGGAIATVAADLVLLAGYGWGLLRAPQRVALPWRRFGALAAATGIAAALVVLPLATMPLVLAASAIFGCALWATGLVPGEVLAALPLARRER